MLCRAFVVSCVFLFIGCRREDSIQTFRVPKEENAPMPPAGAAGEDMNALGADLDLRAAASRREVLWNTPAGWTAQAVSAMRVGSFLVRGENGRTADVSVVPLSGDAGGILGNINRWRGQVQLPPLSAADLPRESRTIDPGGHRMTFVDFSGPDAPSGGSQRLRIVAAICVRGGRTWFFKMTGDAATVGAAKPSFMRWLESVRFSPS